MNLGIGAFQWRIGLCCHTGLEESGGAAQWHDTEAKRMISAGLVLRIVEARTDIDDVMFY